MGAHTETNKKMRLSFAGRPSDLRTAGFEVKIVTLNFEGSQIKLIGIQTALAQ